MSFRWAVGLICIVMLFTTGCETTKMDGTTGVGTPSRTKQPADNSVANSTASHPILANLTSIKQYYADHHEKTLKFYQMIDGVLVEWNFGVPTITSRYDWWDDKTGQKIGITTDADFTKVLRASSADIQLVAYGPNSVDSSLTFPYIIDNYRGPNANETIFQMEKRPYYLLLSHQVKFGDGKGCVMTNFNKTLDGWQASFGPLPGRESLFDAGGPGCPTMETSYDSKDHIFTVRFHDTTLSEATKQATGNLVNEFVKSAEAFQNGSDTVLHMKLASVCTNYNGLLGHLYDQKQSPYVAIHFAGHVDWTYPAIEEQP